MRRQGWTDEEIHALVTETEPGEKMVKKIVASLKAVVHPGLGITLSVDYSRSLAKMVKAGNYDYVNNNIIEKNFPLHFRSQTEVTAVGGGPFRTPGRVHEDNGEFVLVHLDRIATTDEVLQHLNKLGLEPAEIEELLAFGEKYPDIQREYPIVVLGSVWRSPDGYRFCPGLYGDSGRRVLRLRWIDYRWHEDYRFLARRKQ